MADRITVPRIDEASRLEGRLVKGAEYGACIRLRCRNHPELVWQTKNISPIGCRRVFFDLMEELGGAPECACPLDELEPEPINRQDNSDLD